MDPIFWIIVILLLLCGYGITELLYIGLIIWLVLMLLGVVAQASGGAILVAIILILVLKSNRRRW